MDVERSLFRSGHERIETVETIQMKGIEKDEADIISMNRIGICGCPALTSSSSLLIPCDNFRRRWLNNHRGMGTKLAAAMCTTNGNNWMM
ncbi:unnamed protein product, partial [Mesorhabditis spiculigera]